MRANRKLEPRDLLMTTGRRKNGNGHSKRSLAARGSMPTPPLMSTQMPPQMPTQMPTQAPVQVPPQMPRPRGTEAKRALPVISEPAPRKLPNTPTCTSCGLCCSYVAIEIDSPVTVKQATQLLWYVYHEGISLYVNDDDWMVQFDTTCVHLQPDYRCGVYETRPHICREFSEQDCEVNTGDDGRTFYTASEFLEHLAQTRPRIHAIVKKSFSPPVEATRSRLAPFEHRFAAVMSRRSALGV
jgi:Fe-S-cluster containining protein